MSDFKAKCTRTRWGCLQRSIRPSSWNKDDLREGRECREGKGMPGSVTARHSSTVRQPNFAELNRGRTYIRQGGHHAGQWPTLYY